MNASNSAFRFQKRAATPFLSDWVSPSMIAIAFLPIGFAWPLGVLLILSSIALFVYQLATTLQPNDPESLSSQRPTKRSKMRRTRKGKHSRRSSLVPIVLPPPEKLPPPTPIVIAPLNATTLYQALRQHDKIPEPPHRREIPLETPPESVAESVDEHDTESEVDNSQPPPVVGPRSIIRPIYALLYSSHSSFYFSPSQKQPFDAFLVVDVEATCVEGGRFDFPNEIVVRACPLPLDNRVV